MTPYAAEVYRSITGQDLPKPFHEKTPEEQRSDRDAFLQMVRESSNEDDDAVDELFRIIRINRHDEASDISADLKEIA